MSTCKPSAPSALGGLREQAGNALTDRERGRDSIAEEERRLEALNHRYESAVAELLRRRVKILADASLGSEARRRELERVKLAIRGLEETIYGTTSFDKLLRETLRLLCKDGETLEQAHDRWDFAMGVTPVAQGRGVGNRTTRSPAWTSVVPPAEDKEGRFEAIRAAIARSGCYQMPDEAIPRAEDFVQDPAEGEIPPEKDPIEEATEPEAYRASDGHMSPLATEPEEMEEVAEPVFDRAVLAMAGIYAAPCVPAEGMATTPVLTRESISVPTSPLGLSAEARSLLQRYLVLRPDDSLREVLSRLVIERLGPEVARLQQQAQHEAAYATNDMRARSESALLTLLVQNAGPTCPIGVESVASLEDRVLEELRRHLTWRGFIDGPRARVRRYLAGIGEQPATDERAVEILKRLIERNKLECKGLTQGGSIAWSRLRPT